MQVSGNTGGVQGPSHIKKKQQTQKNENQQPPIQWGKPEGSQAANTPGLNSKLNVTA